MSADVLSCRSCGHQFPREMSCPSCGGDDLSMYMRAPSRDEIRSYVVARDPSRDLTEIDPEWRERFRGDEQRALEFYRGVQS